MSVTSLKAQSLSSFTCLTDKLYFPEAHWTPGACSKVFWVRHRSLRRALSRHGDRRVSGIWFEFVIWGKNGMNFFLFWRLHWRWFSLAAVLWWAEPLMWFEFFLLLCQDLCLLTFRFWTDTNLLLFAINSNLKEKSLWKLSAGFVQNCKAGLCFWSMNLIGYISVFSYISLHSSETETAAEMFLASKLLSGSDLLVAP